MINVRKWCEICPGYGNMKIYLQSIEWYIGRGALLGKTTALSRDQMRSVQMKPVLGLLWTKL
jgi:hypothetical protein